MAELTFWTHITGDDLDKKVSLLRQVVETFYNREDYELVIINSYEGDISAVSSFEQEFTDNVMLVDCAGEDLGNPFDIVLNYAGGMCFMEISSEFVLAGNVFDSLLYDPECCDEDTFKYIRNKYTYIMLGNKGDSFCYSKEFEHKCLADYRDSAGNVDHHYFYQDIYVASKVRKMGISHIYDIGSRVDGYISHLLSMDIGVTMIDIRPLDYKADGLSFVQGNALELAGIGDSSLQYLSCLHALEHFGLGRYGDPMDFDGWKKALFQFRRVLKHSGTLILSVPVGRTERVCFNAHRVFNPLTIVNELGSYMRLLEFTSLYADKKVVLDFSNNASDERMRDTLQDVTDNMLGEYDCGIFTFMKY